MPLSGAASGRPLVISLVSRRGHRWILLATSCWSKCSVSAAHGTFSSDTPAPGRRRGPGLDHASSGHHGVRAGHTVQVCADGARGRADPDPPNAVAMAWRGGSRRSALSGRKGSASRPNTTQVRQWALTQGNRRERPQTSTRPTGSERSVSRERALITRRRRVTRAERTTQARYCQGRGTTGPNHSRRPRWRCRPRASRPAGLPIRRAHRGLPRRRRCGPVRACAR